MPKCTNAQDGYAQLREFPQLPAQTACNASPEGQAWGKMSQAQMAKQELPGPPPKARHNHLCPIQLLLLHTLLQAEGEIK